MGKILSSVICKMCKFFWPSRNSGQLLHGGQGTGPCPPYNKEYTYALACTRKTDVSCGLQVTHTSYDNDDDNNKRNLQPATAVALHDWKNPVAPSERPLIFGFIQMADGQLTQRGWRDSQEETLCLTININFNYKEYTYALACTRKIDVSCGLRVAHTSYDNDDDNDKRNLQPVTAVTFRFEELGILFA